MLVVSGDASPLRTRPRTCSQRARDPTRRAPRAATARRPAGRREPRARHPPRLADRALAAGQPHRQQVPGALKPPHVADQQLAAPDGAVGPVAGAVEDRADRRARLAVLGEARRQVRVVVLHADELDAVALERVLGRQVLGVQVVGDDLGRDREQPLEVLDPLGERAQRLVVLQVADVVADPGPAPPWPGRTCSSARRRRPAAGPARRRAAAARAGTYPRERRSEQRPRPRPATTRTTESSVRVWIGRSWTSSRSAMPASRSQRVLVAVGDRLVGDVAAGHHQRAAAAVGEQQVVQRRVGQHHARARAAPGATAAATRRVAGRRGRARSAAARAQQLPLGRRRARRARAPRRATDHQRERLVLAVLARPQRATAASSSARQAR